MTTSLAPQAWAQARPPVVHNRRPAAIVTLSDMADPRDHERIVSLLPGGLKRTRQAGAAMIRHARDAVMVALIEPYVLDHVLLAVAPDELGVVLTSEGQIANVWVGDIEAMTAIDPIVHLGVRAAELLAPVASAARATTGVGLRRTTFAMLDGIEAGCRRLERLSPAQLPDGWISTVLEATGFPQSPCLRSLAVCPDEGAPIKLTLPRLCCAGSGVVPVDACPTCPLRSDDFERRSATEEWLRALDESDFQYVTGRARQRTSSVLRRL